MGSVFGCLFLGNYSGPLSGSTARIALAPKSIETFKQRIRLITVRVGGKSMIQIAEQMRSYLPGLKPYFRLARAPQIFKNLD